MLFSNVFSREEETLSAFTHGRGGLWYSASVLDRKIERQIPNSEPVFLDRSLLDNVAYRRHFNNDDCRNYEILLGECEEYYDNVFILERIDFQDDAVRSEDDQEAQEIHSLIVDSYEMLGYSPVHISVKPVDERVDMILNNI